MDQIVIYKLYGNEMAIFVLPFIWNQFLQEKKILLSWKWKIWRGKSLKFIQLISYS